ncbi:hypothetical protein [Streptomyces sp. NPDC127098]|uniref:hypothetical protein n=1 Tax=Streptomyces sp. NPDC127098 TaxID=3347137 RepID=UPI003669B3A9
MRETDARAAGTERRVMEKLVRTGTVDPENAGRARGLGGWQPLPDRAAGPASLSEALAGLRDEEER